MTEVLVREIDAPLVLVHLANGEVIETTEEHPFFVGCAWVRADQLQPGDILNGAFGGVPVLAIEHTNRLATVHNLEVEGVHNYRVGEGGVVVHNGLTGICKVIRDRYVANALDIPSATYRRFGSPSEEAARWAHARRNEIRELARSEMRQNGLHEAADNLDITDPPKLWEELQAKHGKNWAAIIESASRTRKMD